MTRYLYCVHTEKKINYTNVYNRIHFDEAK